MIDLSKVESVGAELAALLKEATSDETKAALTSVLTRAAKDFWAKAEGDVVTLLGEVTDAVIAEVVDVVDDAEEDAAIAAEKAKFGK